MKEDCKTIIRDEIAPLVQSGRMVLFLGAGFSCETTNIGGTTIPLGWELKKRILEKAGYSDVDITSVDLETAFSIGEDEIGNFRSFLEMNFLCKEVNQWQKIPFYHYWRRIFTTNIDNVIDISVEQIKNKIEYPPDFKIYNYRDRAPVQIHPLSPPIVYLHGKLSRFEDGFVFDKVSYADHSVKSGDWLYDAAFHLAAGHCIILGSKLNESDLETELRKRKLWESNDNFETKKNWIVLSKFNEIEIKSYLKRGLVPIEASSKEFLEYLSTCITPLSPAKLLKRIAPHLQIEITDAPSVAWFNESFSHVPTVCKRAKITQGIYSRFFTGDMPDWFYISNEIPSKFDYINDILKRSNEFFVSDRLKSVCLISITGPVASGKTTLCKMFLSEISKTVNAVYEYSSFDGIDINFAWETIKNIKGPIVLFFDKSAEHFFAINKLGELFLREKSDAKLLFLVEERDNQYQRNRHHLNIFSAENKFNFLVPFLSEENSALLFDSLQNVGLVNNKFKNRTREQAGKIIADIEKGYRGDLLATLYDITGQKTFKEQLNEEYIEIKDEIGRNLFRAISIVSAARLPIPVQYLSEILKIGSFAVLDILHGDLRGKIFLHSEMNNVSSRHSVISEYHVKNLFSNDEKESAIIDIMNCISKKFSIKDLRKIHPLPYRIYKAVLNHYFLRDIVFPNNSQKIENVYSKCQGMFVEDGIYWLQYGRFLYDEKRYIEAEHCFRKGLEIYETSYQIRHALGQVLLKRYVESNCTNEKLFEEGTDILASEIASRGETDPYSFTTLCNGLMDILDFGRKDEILESLKYFANEGMKRHRSDSAFNRMVQRGLSSGYLGLV